MTSKNEAVRARLRQTFDVEPTAHPIRWSDLWAEGTFIPWDKGMTSPALTDLLASSSATGTQSNTDLPSLPQPHVPPTAISAIRSTLEAAQHNNRPALALVPGCGKGYEVPLLSSHGFLAWGVDCAAEAIRRGGEELCGVLQRHETSGGGRRRLYFTSPNGFVEGDFWANDWVADIAGLTLTSATNGVASKSPPGQPQLQFDLIYDYTFLCALPPPLRKNWAKRTVELLMPGTGLLVCLEFPLYKDINTGGPPWGLTSEVYDQLLGECGAVLVERYRPARTYAISEGSDMVSIWRRKM